MYTRFSASSWRLRPSWATHPQQATRRRPWRSGVGEGRRQRNLLTPPTSSNRLPRRIPHHPHPSVVPSRRYKSLQIGASSALIIHLVKVALRLAGLGCLTPCIALVEQIFVLITYVALRPSPAPPPTRSPTHRHHHHHRGRRCHSPRNIGNTPVRFQVPARDLLLILRIRGRDTPSFCHRKVASQNDYRVL